MFKAVPFLGLCLALSIVPAVAATRPAIAPADEYFGPFKVSILEIRNRLNRYDAFGDRAPLSARVVGELDAIGRAIVDWQNKYPRDPWVPRSIAHLLHEYSRAGAARSPKTASILRQLGVRR